jgi:hypothetical protein
MLFKSIYNKNEPRYVYDTPERFKQQTIFIMQHAFKSVNNCLNINIYFYLETSGGQSSTLHLSVMLIFSTPVLNRHLWQVKTVVLHCIGD